MYYKQFLSGKNKIVRKIYLKKVKKHDILRSNILIAFDDTSMLKWIFRPILILAIKMRCIKVLECFLILSIVTDFLYHRMVQSNHTKVCLSILHNFAESQIRMLFFQKHKDDWIHLLSYDWIFINTNRHVLIYVKLKNPEELF